MKINKLVVLKLIPLVILLIVLIVDPIIIVRVLNYIVVSINNFILNKGLKGIAYYVMLNGVVLLIFRRVIRRSWERFKVKYMAPINTYSKGKALPGHNKIDAIYDEDKMGGAITFNEKSTMKLYSLRLPNRKATTTNKALRSIINQIGPENILSITSDNGVEFAYSKVIEVFYDLKWYYCDPYSSYQRGQNERLNRDIRKYIPKGHSIKQVSQKDYNNIIDAVNNKPRRKFNGLSANEYVLLNSTPKLI